MTPSLAEACFAVGHVKKHLLRLQCCLFLLLKRVEALNMVSSAVESCTCCTETEDHLYKMAITQDRPTDAGCRDVGFLDIEDCCGFGWQEVHCFVPSSTAHRQAKTEDDWSEGLLCTHISLSF